jgi:hypothetical protein
MVVCVVEWRTTVHTASRDGGVWCGIKKLLCALHHLMVVCAVEWRTTVRTASRDGGVWCGIKNCCAHCITWWLWVLWNEKLLCALHHVMLVCVVEWKTTVRNASLDGGVCCGIQNYCAHCITWCKFYNITQLFCNLFLYQPYCAYVSVSTGYLCSWWNIRNCCVHCIMWCGFVLWNPQYITRWFLVTFKKKLSWKYMASKRGLIHQIKSLSTYILIIHRLYSYHILNV